MKKLVYGCVYVYPDNSTWIVSTHTTLISAENKVRTQNRILKKINEYQSKKGLPTSDGKFKMLRIGV